MDIKIRYIGNVQFEASTRGHRVVCDQPASNGGSDAGMTPPELLLASLGACSGHYAAEYLKARSLPAEGLEVTVSAEKQKPPARLGKFRVEVTLPGLDPAHEAGLLRAVQACLIHNTLTHSPEVSIEVKSAVPA